MAALHVYATPITGPGRYTTLADVTAQIGDDARVLQPLALPALAIVQRALALLQSSKVAGQRRTHTPLKAA